MILTLKEHRKKGIEHDFIFEKCIGINFYNKKTLKMIFTTKMEIYVMQRRRVGYFKLTVIAWLD